MALDKKGGQGKIARCYGILRRAGTFDISVLDNPARSDGACCSWEVGKRPMANLSGVGGGIRHAGYHGSYYLADEFKKNKEKQQAMN